MKNSCEHCAYFAWNTDIKLNGEYCLGYCSMLASKHIADAETFNSGIVHKNHICSHFYSHSSSEIDRLANYILKEWDFEIGKGNPQCGESAVDVAIRLMKELKEIRGEEYPVMFVTKVKDGTIEKYTPKKKINLLHSKIKSEKKKEVIVTQPIKL